MFNFQINSLRLRDYCFWFSTCKEVSPTFPHAKSVHDLTTRLAAVEVMRFRL